LSRSVRTSVPNIHSNNDKIKPIFEHLADLSRNTLEQVFVFMLRDRYSFECLVHT